MAQSKIVPEWPTPGCILLLLLVAADLAFVIVHVARGFLPFLSDEIFSLVTERGYAEIFQYVKFYWIALLLAALWWRTRQSVYGAWMLLYGYFLFDDSIGIHESGGEATAGYWNYANVPGIGPQALGELTVSAVLGFLFLMLILIAYLRSADEARNASKNLTLLLAVLVFFGVFIDLLHAMVGGGFAGQVFGVLEDGGEMFAASVTCWYVFDLVVRCGSAPTSWWQRTRTALKAAGVRRANTRR